MKIIIKGTKVDLSEAIKNYIEEKIGGLAKYLPKTDPESIVCRVEVGREMPGHHKKGDVFRAEANLDIWGQVWRAEGASDEVYTALDKVHDELKREIISRKRKMIDKRLRQLRKKNQ